MIPKLEENIPKLESLLAVEEAALEKIKDNAKGAFIISFQCMLLIDEAFFEDLVAKSR